MANMATEIIVKKEVRPCIVGGQKALFHGFTEISEVCPPSMIKGGRIGRTIKTPFAIVEFEDGSIKLQYVQNIKFCDSKSLFAEYAFYKSEDVEYE